MARVRIRTLKPENWSDENVGDVSRDARLLRDVLITFSDDDGRWRHRAVEIIGFGYPEDDDVTPAKIKKWSTELHSAGLVHLYEANGKPYGCFPKWHLHQSMQKYQPSELPDPPSGIALSRAEAASTRGRRGSLNGLSSDDTQTVPGSSVDDSPAHARVVGGVPSSVRDPSGQPETVVARAALGDDELLQTIDEMFAILEPSGLRIDAERQMIAGQIRANASLSKSDHIAVAHIVSSWAADELYATTSVAKALEQAYRAHQKRQGDIKAIRTGFGPKSVNPDFQKYNRAAGL